MSSLAGERQDSHDPPSYAEKPPNMDDLLRRPVSNFDPPSLRSLSKNVSLPVGFSDIKSLDKKRNSNEAFEDGEPEPTTQSGWEESMFCAVLKCHPRVT